MSFRRRNFDAIVASDHASARGLLRLLIIITAACFVGGLLLLAEVLKR